MEEWFTAADCQLVFGGDWSSGSDSSSELLYGYLFATYTGHDTTMRSCSKHLKGVRENM